MTQFMFCRVCRINHDKGKGHKYGVKHKQHLAEFLSKARKKIQDIRLSVKEVTRLQDEDRGRTKFWCAFCEQEIDEKESAFARESAIQHLGGSPHFTSVKKFLSEQGADVADSRRYLISKEEVLKWQEQCKVFTATFASTSGVELPGTNNIHSETSRYDRGSSLAVGNNRQIVSHVAYVDDVQPSSVLTLGSFQKPVPTYEGASSVAIANGEHRWFPTSGATETSQSQSFSNGWGSVAGTSMHYMDPASRLAPANFGIEASTSISKEVLNRSRGVDTAHCTQMPGGHRSAANGLPSAQHIMPSLPVAGQGLSAIVCPPLLSGEGNVHSGATPPWMGPSEDKSMFVAGPSMETLKKQPLSRTQERKLAKLRPPNRVGAAWADMRRAQLEREQRGETLEGVPQPDVTWLPNFGRVWQSGSRLDTRKEFEAEKRREAKRLGRPLGKRGASSSSQSPVQFQPYVSKRQKTEKAEK